LKKKMSSVNASKRRSASVGNLSKMNIRKNRRNASFAIRAPSMMKSLHSPPPRPSRRRKPKKNASKNSARPRNASHVIILSVSALRI